MRPLLLAVALLSCVGCVTRSKPVARAVDRVTGGPNGWFRIHPVLGIDERGALLLPPPTELEQEDDTPYMERILKTHESQFAPVWVDAETPCLGLVGQEQVPTGPVYLLSHGIGGMGKEWVGVIPTLTKTSPAALFMYKWSPYSARGTLLAGLVHGIERIAQCFPQNRLVYVGHSAGGVLGAFAASRLNLGAPPHPLQLLTVASPLAGIGFRGEIADDDDATRFFNDLGAVHYGYPAASPGVSVLHLRTQYPADHVMKPNTAGYAPNAISAAVRGARVVDLPVQLGHDESLLYVAKELAAGRLP